MLTHPLRLLLVSRLCMHTARGTTPAILGGNKEVQEFVEFDKFLHRPSGSNKTCARSA